MFVGVLLTVATVPSHAQSLTTGGVSGNITNSTGAVAPNSTVTLTDLDNGSVQAASSNGSGEFRSSLLKPGRYTVSATAPGFEKVKRTIEISVGNVVTASLVLHLGKAVTTVEASTAKLNLYLEIQRVRFQGNGVGLNNTRARLGQRYGDKQSLRLARLPGGGAVATVSTPYRSDGRRGA